ncbi:MAG TPA: histidine phosphatase family protein [Streptosporangiaceae bacterium]|nr:histidine phosphatase family protein [Streptosporangiaceae bacterium]
MSMRVIVEVAGFARSNGSAAGYGVVAQDGSSGELLAEAAEGIGPAGMAAAVYRGMRTGLATVASIDANAMIDVRTDCRPVVEQLSNRQDVDDEQAGKEAAKELAALRAEVMSAAASFGPDAVVFAWVPRDRNDRAAQMARQACDEDAWQRPLIRTTGVAAPQPEPEARHRGEPADAPAPPMPATTLLLARTAETPMTLARRFTAQTDTELTESGQAQARALATHLFWRGDVDVIASAPALPAAQMAAIAGEVLGLAPLIVDDLAEPHYGEWEGLTFAEVQAGWPEELAAWLADPYAAAPPGGENLNDAQTRVHQAIDALTGQFPHRTIGIFADPTPIKLLAQRALHAAPVAVHRMHLDAAGLTEVDLYADASLVRYINDTGHLSPLAHAAAPAADPQDLNLGARP